MPVEPFRVHLSDEDRDDLRMRLERTRYIPSQPAAGWNAGVPVQYMRELLEQWRTRFDWRAVEARINGFPNHRIEVDGLAIHCVHLRARAPNAIPIMLLHGWPSSFVELLDLAEQLAGDTADPFDVVVPSLPGFGFSDAPPAENWDAPEDGEALLGLMRALGTSASRSTRTTSAPASCARCCSITPIGSSATTPPSRASPARFRVPTPRR